MRSERGQASVEWAGLLLLVALALLAATHLVPRADGKRLGSALAGSTADAPRSPPPRRAGCGQSGRAGRAGRQGGVAKRLVRLSRVRAAPVRAPPSGEPVAGLHLSIWGGRADRQPVRQPRRPASRPSGAGSGLVSAERGQASVEFVGLLLVCCLAFGALLALKGGFDGREAGGFVSRHIVCAVTGRCDRDERQLVAAYGGRDARAVRSLAPNL